MAQKTSGAPLANTLDGTELLRLSQNVSGVLTSVRATAAQVIGLSQLAAAFGTDHATTTGLTYGYTGGQIYSNGANVSVAAGTVALTASVTNYVQRTAAGVVSVNSTGFTAGLIPMARIVAGGGSITSITDARPASTDLRGRQVIAVAATNITLTDAQVNARILSFTGTLTANVVVTFPAYQQEWVVSNETTGAFTLQVQTAGGSPITLASGAAVIVYGNGTLLKGTAAPGGGMTNPMTIAGDVIIGGTSGTPTRLPIGTNGQVQTVVSGAPAWVTPGTGGTVTSVALSAPTLFAVGGSPVTSSGTLALTFASQSANLILASPNGATGVPSMRSLVAADLPTSGATAGTYGSSSLIPVVTVDVAGRVTSITTTSASSGFANPMTTAGDLIVGGTSGAAGRLGIGSAGQVLTVVSGAAAWTTLATGGTVTSASVVTANGVSATVANATTTPAFTFTLDVITPSSVAATGTVTGSNLSGTNTGDQTNITGTSANVTGIVAVANGGTGASTLTGLVKGTGTTAMVSATAGTDYVVPSGSITGTAANITGVATVANGGTGVATLTGLVKGTGTTAMVAATAGTDYVIPSGSITGNAGTATKLQTARTLNGVSFDGSANVTIPIPADYAYACSDETTALTTGTKVTDRASRAMTITSIKASLTIASSSGLVTIDIQKNGTSIFSTLLTINASSTTSVGATTPYALSSTSLAADDVIAISITGAGTGAAGLKVHILGTV